MSSINLEDLSLQEEEEGFTFDLDEEEENQIDFRWCLVGRFLSDRPIHVNSMKVTMADVWRPVKGVKIIEAKTGLFLFQFFHELDMEGVLQGGPWTFDNHMLIVERVQLGVQIENIPLYKVDFWVQVHNLPTGLMVEKVGRALANYIGLFVEYDKNNNSNFWRQYMRLRVRVDVRQPLKKEWKVKNKGGEWCTVHFKYERLGVFCFVCGIMGHAENKCEVRFSMERDDGIREWSKDLRAETRRRSGRPTSRWLKEEGGSNGISGGGNNSGAAFNVDGPVADPTRSSSNNSQSMQPNSNAHQAIVIVPSDFGNRQSIPQPSLQPSINDHNQSNMAITQLLSHNHSVQPLHFNDKPLPINNTSDNTIITHSLPNNDSTIPSITCSPLINESMNQMHTFSFQASPLTHINLINNPMNRPNKPKPALNPIQTTCNPNRILSKKNPTDPKHKPDDPKQKNTQSTPEDMETQSEKKRRREEGKKVIEGSHEQIQHFLSAGPGSQACRDQ
jgi:14-3-3 protein epsilon